jgi:hypothetical protein
MGNKMILSNRLKWRILLRVLPLTGLFCAAKVGMHTLHLEPWAFDSLTGSLFGAATFVVALTLSGTLADYGASERMRSLRFKMASRWWQWNILTWMLMPFRSRWDEL